jgi:hypothetical protein
MWPFFQPNRKALPEMRVQKDLSAVRPTGDATHRGPSTQQETAPHHPEKYMGMRMPERFLLGVKTYLDAQMVVWASQVCACYVYLVSDVLVAVTCLTNLLCDGTAT